MTVLIFLSIFLFWPFIFIFKLGLQQFLIYFWPNLIIGLCLMLYSTNKKYWTYPLTLIGFFSNPLAILPLACQTIDFIIQKNKLILIPITVSLVISGVSLRSFLPNSIFYADNNARQKIITQSELYPNILLARTFQNKPSIYWNNFRFNFFAITDPNNYFFHFHPREIPLENQNLDKFPFLSIVFLIYGIYYLPKSKLFLPISMMASMLILNLSLMKNFDRFDLTLYLLLGIIIFNGFRNFTIKNPYRNIFLVIFLLFTFIQFFRLFI